jgi:hypothetical protein
MRTISEDGLRQLLSQEMGDVFLSLVTIDHEDLDEPIRVVNNNEDIEHNGDTYQAFPFEVNLPGESEETMPKATLKIDIVDQQVTQVIRQLETSPTVTLEVIRVFIDPSTQDKTITSEISVGDFILSNVSYNHMTLSATIGYKENFLSQNATKDIFDKHLFPGIF